MRQEMVSGDRILWSKSPRKAFIAAGLTPYDHGRHLCEGALLRGPSLRWPVTLFQFFFFALRTKDSGLCFGLSPSFVS
jgi:hypothetical protein